MSPGCVDSHIDHCLLCTHNTEPITSHVRIFTLLRVPVCICICMTHFSAHILLSWVACVFQRSVQQPLNVLQGKRTGMRRDTEKVFHLSRTDLRVVVGLPRFPHPRESQQPFAAPRNPIPVPDPDADPPRHRIHPSAPFPVNSHSFLIWVMALESVPTVRGPEGGVHATRVRRSVADRSHHSRHLFVRWVAATGPRPQPPRCFQGVNFKHQQLFRL